MKVSFFLAFTFSKNMYNASGRQTLDILFDKKENEIKKTPVRPFLTKSKV